MRVRTLLGAGLFAVFTLAFGGCALTLAYDDYGDQKAGATNDAGVTCTPKTCADKQANCGDVPDDCGKVLHCGDCTGAETCGAAGPNQCGTGTCQAETCNSLSAFCGTASDGCGKTLECGSCTSPKTCVANECACPTAVTCEQMQAECGTIDDGCGGTTACGNCPPGFECSGTSTGVGQDGNKCVCANPCKNFGWECGYTLDCTASSVLCPCTNGSECNIVPPADVGTCS